MLVPDGIAQIYQDFCTLARYDYAKPMDVQSGWLPNPFELTVEGRDGQIYLLIFLEQKNPFRDTSLGHVASLQLSWYWTRFKAYEDANPDLELHKIFATTCLGAPHRETLEQEGITVVEAVCNGENLLQCLQEALPHAFGPAREYAS
jgi:hypothetical protein